MKTPELSWLEYFAWADPDTPYMRLFRGIAQVAYVALGGDVVDQCLAAARRMDADYQREQALAQLAPPEDNSREKRRPVGHREGAGARRDCFKYEEGGRKRFEQACEMVRKLFRSVLGYDAVIPHEPEETPEHKPEDPELVKRIQARAANLQNLRPPVPRQAAPDRVAPMDEDLARTNVELRAHLRQANVRIEGMQQTIMALHRAIADGVTPEQSRRMAAFNEGSHEPHSQTAPGAQDDRFGELMMSPTEPTAEAMAGFPTQEHETIRAMWRQVQQAESLGISKDLMCRATTGDPQARQQVDGMIEQMYAARA